MYVLLYSARFSWVFNFANFANFQLFAKIFQQNFWHVTHCSHALTAVASMDNIPGLSYRICKELSPRRYLWSRHCFADSCDLKQGTVWRCVLDKLGLYATPIVFTCVACTYSIFIQRNLYYRISSDTTATIYFTARFVWQLFKGGIYFPETWMTAETRYVQVRQWRLLDTVSSMCSCWVLLSAVGMACATKTVLALVVTIVRNHSHTYVCAAFTSRSYYSRAAFISFKSFG